MVVEERSTSLQPFGVLVLLGALVLVAAQAIALTEILDESDSGKQTTMFVLMFVGTTVIGVSLLAAGGFGRGSFGGRVALLAVGAYIVTNGFPASLFPFGFGGLF